MKKIFKILGSLVGLVLVILIVSGIFLHESLPKGQPGPEADALAKKMLRALNFEAYENTRFLSWSFRNNSHHYKWDRQLNLVVIRWDENEVELDLNDLTQSNCFVNNEEVPDNLNDKLIKKAVDKFNNDSFWLVAPYKVFDKGTSRKLVVLPEGEALLVSYSEGGTTPGDSYLWLLNENGFPKAYKMWVKIIPVGGLEVSWDDWIITKSGAFLPKTHQFGPLGLDLEDVSGYNN